MIEALSEPAHECRLLPCSLISISLNGKDREEFGNYVYEHKFLESARRGRNIGVNLAVIDFLKDNPEMLKYFLGKIKISKGSFGNCIDYAFRVHLEELAEEFAIDDDQWYLGQRQDIDRQSATEDFKINYEDKWKEEFERLYCLSVCPHGCDCSKAYQYFAELTTK